MHSCRIEVEICWEPGLSGPELPDEIKGMWAFLSIDNFANPVTMQRKPDHEQTWVGYRLLPPSTIQSLVVFQLNDSLCVAQNVISEKLKDPISIKIVQRNLSEQGISPEHR